MQNSELKAPLIEKLMELLKNPKIADYNGNPLIMYYSKPRYFGGFVGTGYCFTTNPNAPHVEQPHKYEPYYLYMINPYYTDINGVISLWKQYGVCNNLSENLIMLDYDGVIFTDDDGDREYVIFDPKQAKSIYNNGAFNPNTAKISERLN